MKNIATLLTGLIIGLLAGIFLYPLFNSDNIPDHKKTDAILKDTSPTAPVKTEEESRKTAATSKTQDKMAITPRPISPETAYDFFDAYHGISDPSTKKACLKTTVDGIEKDITSIYLPYIGFLDEMAGRVDRHGKSLLGLSGIPAYDPGKATHTLIWVPVVNGPEGNPVYFIPEKDYEGLLMQYIDICPPACPKNECILWNKNWKYDLVNCKDPFN